MLFGLSGSAGTGKTTLAKRVAEDLGITFMPTSITQSAKRHGFDAVSPMTISSRLQMQTKLLDDHTKMISKSDRPLIVDRTPIDMVSYMLAEVGMHSHYMITPQEIEEIEVYVKLCLEVTAQFYDFIFILGQLDTYEIKETRPADNRAYQTHTQLIMQGCMAQLYGRINYAIIRQQDLEDRHNLVHDTLVARMDEITRERASSAHIH